MTKLTLGYKRLSPSASVAEIKDSENKLKCWRHRFTYRSGSIRVQGHEDYPYEDFDSLDKFFDFVDDLPNKPHQIL